MKQETVKDVFNIFFRSAPPQHPSKKHYFCNMFFMIKNVSYDLLWFHLYKHATRCLVLKCFTIITSVIIVMNMASFKLYLRKAKLLAIGCFRMPEAIENCPKDFFPYDSGFYKNHEQFQSFLASPWAITNRV